VSKGRVLEHGGGACEVVRGFEYFLVLYGVGLLLAGFLYVVAVLGILLSRDPSDESPAPFGGA
jgi:hypothetical protein